jgi:hypothetical protein
MALIVPAPTLAQDGNAGPRFKAEKPVALTCGPVRFADGTLVTPGSASQFGFLVYRQGAGGASQAWNEKTKSWVPSTSAVQPQSLFPAPDPALAGKWQAILVAAGQQDSAGNDKLATDPQTGQPTYFVRCSFKAKDAAGQIEEGIGPQSALVLLLSATGPDQVGLALKPKPPATTEDLKLFLMDASLVNEARVEIKATGTGFLIELAANGASLSLTPSGDIVLKPAAGRTVQVQTTRLPSQSLSVNGQAVIVP